MTDLPAMSELNVLAQEEIAEALAALSECRSVLSSINTGAAHRINVAHDDDPVYWQRAEWVAWARDEVLPMVEKVLAKHGGRQ